jgi:hypothetical protein
MSNQEIDKLVSDLNTAEREYDLQEQQFERKKQILLEESRRPITKERASQLLIELGNLNHQRTIENQTMRRKIEEIRASLKQMFSNTNVNFQRNK